MTAKAKGVQRVIGKCAVCWQAVRYLDAYKIKVGGRLVTVHSQSSGRDCIEKVRQD